MIALQLSVEMDFGFWPASASAVSTGQIAGGSGRPEPSGSSGRICGVEFQKWPRTRVRYTTVPLCSFFWSIIVFRLSRPGPLAITIRIPFVPIPHLLQHFGLLSCLLFSPPAQSAHPPTSLPISSQHPIELVHKPALHQTKSQLHSEHGTFRA